MVQVSVSRRQLAIFTVVIALFVSVAWVGVGNQARAGSATPVVYVATGENFPDALGAGPAAAIVKGPMLLVAQNAIPGETAAELTRLAPDKIIIVGGTAGVSPAVEDGLTAYAGTVERIAGANRYDTAAQLSAATYPATIDADTLDGLGASSFLGKTAKAADSDKLDGQDSTAFLAADSLRPVAMALIEPETGRINVATGTGFSKVVRLEAGIYCLTLDPATGVSKKEVMVNVSVEWGNSSGNGLFAFWHDASGASCGPDLIEIRTYGGDPLKLTDNVGFVATAFTGPYKSIPTS